MSFTLAVNDRKRNQQTGEWEDVPGFYDCTLFGKRAESLANILGKGFKCAIEGKLRWSQWERDGQKHSKIEVIVDEVELLSGRKSDERRNPSTSTSGPAIEVEAEVYGDPYPGDEIPF